MPSGTLRLKFVDALRGWAILGVIAGHTAQHFRPSAELISVFAASGGRGVQLFFVVSAFTLLLSLQAKAPTESRWLRSYFIRRFFRIAPLLYTFIALYAFFPEARQFWVGYATLTEHIILGVLFLNGWNPLSINSVVPGGWSIVAEASFYVLLPLWFKRVDSLSKGLTVTFLTVLGVKGFSWLVHLYYLNELPIHIVDDFSFFWLPAQLCVFCAGGLLFLSIGHLYLPSHRAPDTSGTFHLPRADNLALPVLLFGLLLVFALPFGTGYRFLPIQFLYAVAITFIAFALSHRPFAIFVNPVTCFIGKVSYSAYFWHFLIIWALCTSPMRIRLSTLDWSYAEGLATVLGVTILASHFSYVLIEKPFINLGGCLVAKLNSLYPIDRAERPIL